MKNINMKNIKWDFSTPLKNKKLVKEFEKNNGIKLPVDLIKCIEENNGGMPDLNVFDTDKTKGRTIKALLSFNKEEEENVYEFLDLFKEENELKIIPFAIDSFGNLICIEEGKVVIWLHESNTKEIAADSFTDFLSKLRKK